MFKVVHWLSSSFRTNVTLTHWGRVTHICVSKITIICSDNGLSPGRRQAIIWTNAGILLNGLLRTNFSEILIGIQTISFKKLHLKTSSAKWRLFCLGLNEWTPINGGVLTKYQTKIPSIRRFQRYRIGHGTCMEYILTISRTSRGMVTVNRCPHTNQFLYFETEGIAILHLWIQNISNFIGTEADYVNLHASFS